MVSYKEMKRHKPLDYYLESEEGVEESLQDGFLYNSDDYETIGGSK